MSDSESGQRPGDAADASTPGAAAGDSPASDDRHDPTGLDLARSVAAELSRSRPGGTAAGTRRTRPAGPARFSGAHPDDRDPATLSQAVDRLVTDSGWTKEVSVHAVLGRWPSIVGPEVARHCAPESYRDTVVTVVTDSTAWATQLRLLAPTVVARLNAELGDGSVTKIVVRGPGAPSWRRGLRSVRDGRGPRDTYG